MTLVESLITLALVALLCVMSVWRPQGSITQFCHHLARSIPEYSRLAQRRGDALVLFARHPDRLSVIERSSGKLVFEHSLPPTARIEEIRAASQQITFYPRGSATPSSVLLTDGKRSCRVSISLWSSTSVQQSS